jgi:DNA-directed RNA polymerase specialized sigma24 family protein
LGKRVAAQRKIAGVSVGEVTGKSTEVARALNGGADWQAIVGRHVALVHGVCQVHQLSATEAEEVSTMVWLRLAEYLPRLTRPETIGAWIAATARLQCLRTLGRRSGHAPEPLPDPTQGGAPRTALELADGALSGDDGDGWLAAALAALPPVERDVLRLRAIVPRPTHVEVGAALALDPDEAVAAEQRGAARVWARMPAATVWRVEVRKLPGAAGDATREGTAPTFSRRGA